MQPSLLFVAGHHWNDAVVAAVERDEHLPDAPSPLATHCAFLFGSYGVEAAWPRVRVFPRSAYAGALTREYPLRLGPMRAESLRVAALARVGDWYDLLGLARVGWYVATRQPTAFFGDDAATVHCSELVVECLLQIAVPVLRSIPAADITPARLECWAAETCG